MINKIVIIFLDYSQNLIIKIIKIIYWLKNIKTKIIWSKSYIHVNKADIHLVEVNKVSIPTCSILYKLKIKIKSTNIDSLIL